MQRQIVSDFVHLTKHSFTQQFIRYTVQGGAFTVNVPAHSAVALHTGAMTSAPKYGKDLVSMTFCQVYPHTKPDDQLYIIGDIPELGNNKAAQGVSGRTRSWGGVSTYGKRLAT